MLAVEALVLAQRTEVIAALRELAHELDVRVLVDGIDLEDVVPPAAAAEQVDAQ